MTQDRHKTGTVSKWLAIAISAFFVAAGVAGYRRTGDPQLLLLFLALAIVSFGVVKLAFYAINRLLDSMEK